MKQNYFYNWNRNKLRLNWTSFFALLLMTSFGINSIKAQVTGYTFSQSNGSFNSISGGTVLGTSTANTATAAGLYNTSFPVTLPFSFKFNNTNYSALTVSSNGYVTFGTGAATNTAPISSTVTYEGAIAAWGRSTSGVFDVAGKTSNISWTTEGTAPNRVVVIQWENFRPSYTTSITSASVFSFQIRLAETTNVISSSYSATSVLVGTGTYTSTVQIGLRGATNADYLNRYNPSTISFVNSAAGTANSNAQYYHTTTDPAGMPSDGLTYTWTPPT